MRRRKPPLSVRLAQDRAWHDYQMGDRHMARSARPGRFWVDAPEYFTDHLNDQWYPTKATQGKLWDELTSAQHLRQQRKSDPNYRRI